MEESFTVQPTQLANVVGSGSLPVLATPALACAMENTAMHACEPLLTEGETTVGAHLALDHLAPSLVGDDIHITATVTKHTPKKVQLTLAAHSHGQLIAKATHVRTIVNVERFMEHAQSIVNKDES
ncbi:MAG: hypothetical protein Q4A55_01875 [Aerococcus sp.]|nr:hypothetical protein [Aerococcus sp.]